MGVAEGFLDFTTGGKQDKGGKSDKKGLLEMGLGAAMKGMKVPGFKKGGKVKKTGIYELHAGETVVPTGKNACKCHKDSSASMTE